MADLDIRDLQPSEATLARMIEIGRISFGPAYDGAQLRRNWSLGPGAAFYGAFEKDQLVAFNGFLFHTAERDGAPIGLAHSCHSATLPDFRGRGLFSALMMHGRAALGGDYLIGFGNLNSRPIMVNRLGFRQISASRVYFPAALNAMFLRTERLSEATRGTGRIAMDERRIAAWKTAEWPAEIVQFEYSENFVWGRLALRRIGPITIKTLQVGGWALGDPAAAHATLKEMSKVCDFVNVEFVTPQTSTAAKAAKLPLPGDKAEPFAWLANKEADENPFFDLYAGVKDNW